MSACYSPEHYIYIEAKFTIYPRKSFGKITIICNVLSLLFYYIGYYLIDYLILLIGR